MKTIMLLLTCVSCLFITSLQVNAQIDSTQYVISLVNGNEYKGIILSDDGREILIETQNLGKIYVLKSDISTMKKEAEIKQILKSKYQSVITLSDGSEIIGHILSDDGKEVVVETEKLGKVYLEKKEIKDIVRKVEQEDIYFGEHQSEGPFTTRYAFSNNALPIKKGENYAMINLYGPEAHFAVTDHLNIGIMSTWIGSPIAIAAKYTFKSKESNLNFSIGTLTGSSGYIRSFAGFGSLNWASMTLGDRKNNFTLSAGYGFFKSGKEYYNGDYKTIDNAVNGPAFSAAGIVRVGAKTSLIFEGICFSYTKKGSYYEYNYDPSTYVSTQREVKYTDNVVNLLIMPGLRFQKTPKKAFQISLAGLSVYHSHKFSQYDNGKRSFPMPMLSWFYKL